MTDVVANSAEEPVIPNTRKPKEFTLNEEALKDLLYNQSSRDQTFLKRFFDPRRDIDNECGYPGLGESPEISEYKSYYDTHCVATRVCEIYPLETWQVQPTVYEDDDPNIQTEFEKAWDELGAGLRGQSYHKNEEGSPIWNYLMNADILSGIGSFGIILLGFDDGGQLNEPIAMLSDEDEEEEPTWDTSEESPESTESELIGNLNGSVSREYSGGNSLADDKIPVLKEGTKRKLIYMRAFDESLVRITRLETDRSSPRYGQPVMYNITLFDPQLAKNQMIAADLASPDVHWTRVIHIAETKGSNSEVFGIPRQQQVWRQLLNLYKLYGGAPEMYWRGALNGLSFETHPQLGGDVEINEVSLKNQIENYRNSLQRDLLTVGMTVKSVAPTVVDPTPNIEIQIQAICIKLACPQRIFMGSERGELASSQDDSSWNDRLKHRQNTYVTPKVIIPFVDRMIATGVLPKPANRVIADKNEEATQSEQEDNETVVKDMETIESVMNFNPSQPRDSRGRWSQGRGINPAIGQTLSALTFENFQSATNKRQHIEEALNAVAIDLGLKPDTVKVINDQEFNAAVKQGAKNIGVNPNTVKAVSFQNSGDVKFRERSLQEIHDQNSHRLFVQTAFHELGHSYDSQILKSKRKSSKSIEQYEASASEEFADVFGSRLGIARKKALGHQKGIFGLENRTDLHSYLQETPTVNGLKLLANAFPPKTAQNGAKTPASGLNGVKPAFGKPAATSDPSASGGMPAPTAKKRSLPTKEESPGYCVVWPDLDSMTDAQKAQIGLQRTQALMAFIAGNGESAMTLIDFWTKFMYMSDEEAIAMVKAVNEMIEEDERLTPDPEDARQEEMDMQGEQFDKELEAKKELAEQGHGFGMEMQESQQGFQEKIADKTLAAKAKEKKKPTTNRVMEIIGKYLSIRSKETTNDKKSS